MGFVRGRSRSEEGGAKGREVDIWQCVRKCVSCHSFVESRSRLTDETMVRRSQVGHRSLESQAADQRGVPKPHEC